MEQQASDFVIATRAALAQLTALGIQYSFSVVGAILLLVVGWLVAGVIGRSARRGLSRIHGIDATLAQFFSNIIHYAILILVVVMVLGQFGVQTASILAALGAIGLAVGLALQGTLQNIAAGIMLLVLRPFRVGEYIETGAVSGTVQDIGLFATQLKTGDGLYRLAPNSVLWNVPVTNYSRFDTRMNDIAFTIGYDDDIDAAQKLMLELAASDPRVLKQPAPSAYVSEVTASSVTVTLRYWARNTDWWMASRDLTKAAKLAFDKMKPPIPYPQDTYRDVSGESGPSTPDGANKP